MNVREMYLEEGLDKPFIEVESARFDDRFISESLTGSIPANSVEAYRDCRNKDRKSYIDQYRLQCITNKLVSTSLGPDMSVPVKIIDCDTYSAASDEDTIMICSEILEMSELEEEIAFVLAHEVGHIALQHKSLESQKQEYQSSKNTWLYYGGWGLILVAPEYALLSLGGLAMYDNWGQAYAKYQTIPEYLRQEEDEADLMAIDLMVAANYNPYYAIDAIDQITYVEKEARTSRSLSPEEESAIHLQKTASPYFTIDQSIYRHIREGADIRDHEDGKERAKLISLYIDHLYRYTADWDVHPIQR